MNNSNRFEYNYSALTQAERKEVESIRRRYIKNSNKEDKTVELRRLDFYVRSFPLTLSIIIGVIGVLLFGFGLALVLEFNQIRMGIVFSVLGMIVAIPTKFIYDKLLAFQKKKYGARILDITEKLLEDNDENIA